MPEDLDASLCTHVIYAFSVLDEKSLTLKIFDEDVDIKDSELTVCFIVLLCRLEAPRNKEIASNGLIYTYIIICFFNQNLSPESRLFNKRSR